MSRKRDKPYPSHHVPARISKRRRPFARPQQPAYDDLPDKPVAKPPPPPALVVMGLPHDCSVLDLKSRFEIYGSISRIRIDGDGVGCIAYRTIDSAEAAIAAALDPSFGITIDSNKVKVMWATDPLAQWREGVGAGGGNKERTTSSSSKLLRGEVPLSRHGRGNKLASAIVNPRNGKESCSVVERPFKDREMVAYDDIL